MRLLRLLLSCVCLQCIGASDLDACPAGLPRDQYLQVHGGYCYRFVTFRHATHSAAKSDCESNGGHLVYVRDQETQSYIYDQLAHTYRDSFDKVWLGLNDITTEGVYLWEDGTALSYSNWDYGQGPSSSSFGHDTKDCVVVDMLSEGKWQENACETSSFLILFSGAESHSYICQYPARILSQTVIIHLGDITTQSVVSLVNHCPALTCTLGCSSVIFVYDPNTGCPACACAN
ncbi:perlucin protein [Biomphalaria glabrata]|nr:perlucin protein [Biomphalaria glabrata]